MQGEAAATHEIVDVDGLRQVYSQPNEKVWRKALRGLDEQSRNFIALSPFVCVGTSGPEGANVSPRGDAPGFVRVLDDRTLALPDQPGNNRIESMISLVSNPQIGLLFLVPGLQETLRIKGHARICRDATLLARCAGTGKPPICVLLITIDEAFLHCPKALNRSRLWQDDYRVDRADLATPGKMTAD